MSISGHFYKIVIIFVSNEEYKTYTILKDSDGGKLYFKSRAVAEFLLLRVETNSNKRSGNRINPPKLWAQRLRIAFSL
jgi:hypothetical protein